jgi:replicative DNA helicase
MVMFLYRPEYYGINNDEMGQPIDGETHIHVAKHRNGSTDTVKVRFIKEYQKFVDLPDDNFGGFGGGNGGGGGFGPYGGANSTFDRPAGSGGFKPQTENPQAGIRGRNQPDTSEFGGSKMFIPGGFQTMPSKANDYNFDDDDMPAPFKQKPNPGQMDEDVPF